MGDTQFVTEETSNPLMTKLQNERKTAFDYQERRHDAWDEIYRLYRNIVRTNRLTQRQAVYIPLMKETIKTNLSKVDDPPNIDWVEMGGDLEKAMLVQEIWNDDYTFFNYEGVDMQDKKTVLTYGRGFKKLLLDGDRVRVAAMDVYDIIIDPLTNPLDIETARFVIHQNIFKSLKEIMNDKKYSAKGKASLKSYFETDKGIAQSSQNRQAWEDKMERMKDAGVNEADLDDFAGGDVIVNCTEHLTQVWEKDKWVRKGILYADTEIILIEASLKDLIGVDFWPYVSWAEDVETSDWYSDGLGDLILTPNKLLNIWFSQLVENRTLRNFQMHWYDSTNENFTPQTYEPGPGRMLPAPGDPNKTITPVEISGLDETMTAIDFLTKIIERSSAATAIEKGTSERNQITLGEVQMLVGKSMERTLAMAKFYRRSWEELAYKWVGMSKANATDGRELFKMSSKGKLWKRKAYPKEWVTGEYKPFVRSSSEQDEEKTQSVQRFQFAMGMFPENTSLKRIGQKRILDVLDLTAEEMREISDEEKQRIEEASELLELAPQPIPGTPEAPPAQPPIVQQ